MFELRQPAEVDRLDRLVVVEVDERDLVMAQHVAEAAGGDEVFDVAPVAGAFRDQHLGGALAAAQFDHGGDDVRMRVDDLVAVVLDEVRLEDDALALERNALAEVLVLPAHHVGEVGVVVADGGDVDAGLRIERPEVGFGLDQQGFDADADAFAEGRRSRGRQSAPDAAAVAASRPARRNGFARPAFRARAVSACRSGAGRTHGVSARAAWAARMRSSSRGSASRDAGMIRVGVEGQPRPAEMFEVFAVVGLSPQKLRRRRDVRVGRPALQRQQHDGRGRGNRLQRDAEDAAVAVVDAALVQGAVEQQLLAFPDARVIALAGAPQGQARPRGRFHP